MAFTAEVKAKLGLDTSEFKRALTKTAADLGDIGGDINRKMRRSFGADDVFKGLLQGIGIGSVESVVDFISRRWTGMTKEVEENYKRIGEISDKNTEDTIAGMRKLATEETRYQLLIKERARLQTVANEGAFTDTASKVEGWLRRMGSGPIKPLNYLYNSVANLFGNAPEEQATAKTASAEDAKKRQMRVADEIAQIEKDRTERQQKHAADAADKKLQLETELSKVRKSNAEKEATTQEKIIAEEKRLREIATLAAEDDVSTQLEIAEIQGKILDLKKQQRSEAEKNAEAEERAERALRDAGIALDKATRKKADELRDSSATTLADVAAGRGGNPTMRSQAKRVLSMRERAKRIRGMTGLTDGGIELDPGTVADNLMIDSNKLASGIGALPTSEKNPMASIEEAISSSEKHLEEIKNSLKRKGISASGK